MAVTLTQFWAGFRGDYFTDRIVRIYSVALFIILAVVMAIEFRHENAITCWAPAYFTSNHEHFTRTSCKQSKQMYGVVSGDNTGVLSSRAALTHDPHIVPLDKLEQLPLVVAAQSLLFLIPWIIWKVLSGGLCNLDAVITEASAINSESGSAIAGQLHKLLKHPCSVIGSIGGGFLLTLSYLSSKLGYWIICFVQMDILGKYLGINFFTYRLYSSFWEPYSYVQIIPVEDDNETLPRYMNVTVEPFPTQVICSFMIRQMGNAHNHAVQCSLEMNQTAQNMLNIIWLWLVILLVITSISGAAQFFKFILWCVGPSPFRKHFLETKLYSQQIFNAFPNTVVQKFGALYFKPDFFFVIGMIEENGSMGAASLAVKIMWVEFLRSSKLVSYDTRSAPVDVQPLITSQHSTEPSNVGPAMPPPAYPPQEVESKI